MNRKERRKLEREGKIVKSEPVYAMKLSEVKTAAFEGVGKQAMMHEIHQQCLVADKEFTLDLDTLYIWTLHTKYGWGLKRLKQLYIDVFTEHLRMREFYEVDDMYPERRKLKEKGIDVEAWYNELFDNEGNFKRPEEVRI